MKKRTQTKNLTYPTIHSNIRCQVLTTFAFIRKILFNHLQTLNNIGLTILTILSSIMDTLPNAYTRIKSFQLKPRELSLKGYSLEIKKKQLFSNVNENHPPPPVSLEALQLIEKQLNLFSH